MFAKHNSKLLKIGLYLILRVNKDTLSIIENNIRSQKSSVMRFGKKKLYWLSQLSGWSFFVILNIIIVLNYVDLPLERIFVWGGLGLCGVIVTHFL